MTKQSNLCPVCAYDLGFPAWAGISASHEICPCCGIQFGYDDFAGGDVEKRLGIYKTRRDEWIAGGMVWFSKSQKRPVGWKPSEQLRRLMKKV